MRNDFLARFDTMISSSASHTKLFPELGQRHRLASLDLSATMIDLSPLQWSGSFLSQKLRSQTKELKLEVLESCDHVANFALCECQHVKPAEERRACDDLLRVTVGGINT